MLFVAPSVASAKGLPCEGLLPHDDGAAPRVIPNVDVHGNPVVPADINAVEAPLGYPIRIPVQMDIAEYLGLDLSNVARGALDLNQTELAFFEVHDDGRVLYNGQDLTSQLDEACSEAEHLDALHDIAVPPLTPSKKPNIVRDTVIDGIVVEGQYP